MTNPRWQSVLFCIALALLSPLVADAQQKPDKRLLQKVSVKWESKPIEEAFKELSEKHKLPIEFDTSFSDEGLQGAPVTLTADGITLGSAIRIACVGFQLVPVLEKGKLLVVSRAADDEKLISREYSLAALGGIIDPQVLSLKLPEFTSWKWMEIDQEGGEVVGMTLQSITIRQTRTAHEDIQKFFDQLATVVSGKARAATPQDRAEQLIFRKLQTPALPPADVTTLPEIFDALLRKNGVPYWVNEQSFQDENIEWQKLTSTLDAKKIATTKRLDALAAEHKFSWRYEDEVIQVTSAEKALQQMFIRTYEVRNKIGLNNPIEALVQQLVKNEDLGPWQVNDGTGAGIMSIGTSLMIRHNSNGHAKLAKLLN